MKKDKKILFFIEGAVPTEDDKQQAAAIPGWVVFRNALMDSDGHAFEDAHDIAGKPPLRYKRKYKKVDSSSDIPSEEPKKAVKWSPNK